MLINSETLDLAFKGFKSVYTDAYLEAPVHYDRIAMTVPSSSRDETYGWMGMFPHLREWVGPRHVKNLKAHGFAISNKKFEATVSVSRDDLSDDKLGVYKPMFSEMGQAARRHPEEMVFDLLKSGFATECYDGQYFFDTDHPVIGADEAETTVSNMQSGSGPAWFLLDVSRSIRPIIWQEREKYEFQSLTQDSDHHVFINDEYMYGVRARVNAGFGLWQLAFGSKGDLNTTNYASARAAMMKFRADGGRILGVKPTVMVVPPELEEDALQLLNAENDAAGASNVWRNTAELIVTPYLSE